VIVKLLLLPVQPFALGVTIIVAITGLVPEFIPAKLPMFPVPFAAKPIDGVSLIQLKFVPDTAPLNVIEDVFDPLQIV
jgi:hypothetical protein